MSGAVRGAFRQFYHHDGFFLAAGLSFYIMICLVPLLMLMVAGGGYLLSNDRVVREVLDRLETTVPVYQSELEQFLLNVVAARRVSSVVGSVVLLLFATQLFAATRLVLNRTLGTEGRGLLHGVLFDIGMVVLLTLLFLITVGVTATLSWAKAAFSLLDDGVLEASLFEWLGLLVAMATNTALFVLLYRVVPVRRVAWGTVLRASLAAAALWEVAKQLFRWYIQGIGLYSTFYGPLGATIALVMWVYYSAMVFVFGAALIHCLEEQRGRVPDPGRV